MRKLFIVVLALMMSGCAITDYAKTFIDEMVDTAKYEKARETAVAICDQETLDRLDKFLGEELHTNILSKCKEKRVIPQPLN